jgi:oligopeptide/dipeptide ABC transporter ATP-binding protein
LVEEAPAEVLIHGALHPYTQLLYQGGASPAASSEGAQGGTKSPPGCPFAPRCWRATKICQEQRPLFLEFTPGHRVACHHPRA